MSRISYSKEFGFTIHGNCVNFRNGFCTLHNVAVDHNEAACASFIPKNITARPQIRYSYPLQYTLPPHTFYGYGTRHSPGPMSSAPAAPRQGSAGLLYASSGRRGGGRGGGVGGGRGRGRMGGFAAGPGGSCVCPRCGYSTSHVIGTPCYQQTCPKCGSRMTRGT